MHRPRAGVGSHSYDKHRSLGGTRSSKHAALMVEEVSATKAMKFPWLQGFHDSSQNSALPWG